MSRPLRRALCFYQGPSCFSRATGWQTTGKLDSTATLRRGVSSSRGFKLASPSSLEEKIGGAQPVLDSWKSGVDRPMTSSS
ncbi:uncharacterized protein JN550_003664 [Neoarthrinium moseri]|uniref:uncharacterized protein n=1 Tax=Neoarthrinium moseri TaxID=1658444 RepID=UPI001FDE527C|nr:uncharacterized protein JN550_003664 [Neoarthrinium moseri]KAI1872790.1 hypothetical protein JN550_003664 [Neoarthrinium moseri]